MAIYMIQTEDRTYDKAVSICVKNKETAFAVARFTCQAMYGSCKAYDCGEALAKFNRDNYEDNEYRYVDVIVTEIEVVG